MKSVNQIVFLVSLLIPCLSHTMGQPKAVVRDKSLEKAQHESCLSQEEGDLFVAVFNGELERVQQLVDAGTRVNINSFPGMLKDKDNNSIITTPLHVAIERNSFDIVKVLLERGAKTDVSSFELANYFRNKALSKVAAAEDGKRLTILDEYFDREAILVSLLRKNNRGPDAQEICDKCFLKAITYKFFQQAEKFINLGANINSELNNKTPLQFAVDSCNKDAVSFLIRKKADINAVNEFGLAALHFATKECRDGGENIVRLLVSGGANINAADWKGSTALHNVAANDHKDIAELLLKAGAKTDIVDNQNKTPLDIAKDFKSTKVESLLKD